MQPYLCAFYRMTNFPDFSLQEKGGENFYQCTHEIITYNYTLIGSLGMHQTNEKLVTR